MNTADQGLENVIKSSFPNEIQQKRVRKEIQTLKELDQKKYKISLQSTSIGLKIIVEIPKDFAQKELLSVFKSRNATPIFFEIMLDSKFPFVFPKIFCRTMFCEPTAADGRDYINDILGKIWSPAHLLSEIVQLLPPFVKKLAVEANDFVNFQKFGAYHLGHIYNIEDFLVLETVAVFPGQEMLVKTNKEAPRILNFEPADKKKNLIKLISWANIQSLMSLKRKKENEKALIFTWKDKSRPEGLAQIFLLDDSPKCVDLIVNTMKKIGVKVNKSAPKEKDIKLEDVTAASYADMDINQIIENISILESQLQAELTINLINTLTTLYQKAIEYYSAFGNNTFELYVNKLRSILAREDVQAVLRSSEAPSTKKSGALSKGNQEDEEEEKIAGGRHHVDDYDHSNTSIHFGGYSGPKTDFAQEAVNEFLKEHKPEDNENLFAIEDEEETPKHEEADSKTDEKSPETEIKPISIHHESNAPESNKEEETHNQTPTNQESQEKSESHAEKENEEIKPQEQNTLEKNEPAQSETKIEAENNTANEQKEEYKEQTETQHQEEQSQVQNPANNENVQGDESHQDQPAAEIKSEDQSQEVMKDEADKLDKKPEEEEEPKNKGEDNNEETEPQFSIE